MRIQLWSCNYEPEPMGIAPLTGVWAKAMQSRGHTVEVIAAHPHYPEPRWGNRIRPYTENRDGIRVRRLPLFVGRERTAERLLQEATFTLSLGLAAPLLERPDLILSTSPSFPALLPGLLAGKIRRIPWFIWLQDILPDGAVATGYLDDADPVIRASRLLERAAYGSARGIFVLSASFRQNLLAKNVPTDRITVVYNPATLSGPSLYDPDPSEAPRVLCMGNIGRSQGLAEIVRNFESNPELEAVGARLVVAGSGVAEQEVKSAITTDRVEMTGLLDEEGVKSELRRASLAAVTQSYDAGEFNVPSKLMNYLATGMPVVGSVSESGEAARIIRQSESGWISSPGMFGATVVAALRDREELRRRSRNGHRFARENLTPAALADTFESRFRATLPSI